MNIEIFHIEHAGVVLSSVTMNMGHSADQPQTCQAEEVREEPATEVTETTGAVGNAAKTEGKRLLRNVIFKGTMTDPATHRERELQLERLHQWIGEHFVSRLTAKYEWFALWRILYDAKLIEGTRAMTSKFAQQMNDWYGNAPYSCNEGEVNRFRNGYLGETPFTLWDENTYLARLQGKQSYSAFRPLYALCEDLKNTLRTDDFYL